MAQKEIEVTIQADGSSNIDALGFQGKGCAEATAQIELVLGGGSPGNSTDKKKPEFGVTTGTAIQKAA